MTGDLAARVAALTPEQRARLRAALPAARRPELTPGQRRLWRTHHQVGGRPVDVVCQAVHLTGSAVDLDRIADRLLAFAASHEALRTTFTTEGDTVRPVTHAVLPPRLVRTRCADEAEAHALARSQADEAFDLAAGPLLRVTLAEGPAPDEAWLLFAVHNLVFDAWSFELLLDALGAGTTADAPTGTSGTPRTSGTFGRFAADQRAWVGSPAGRAAAAYWAAETADAPPPLPTDRPRTDATTRTGARAGFTLPAAVADAITAGAKREGATAYAGWLAVAWAALAEFGGSDDVLLGTFTTGRTSPDSQDVVGYLLNVLPVRLRGAGDGGHRDRLRSARDITRAGLRHAAYPGELIEAPRRLEGTHPLLDAVFVFDNLGDEERRVQGALATSADLDKATARYDLTLAVYPGPEGVTGWLEFDTALYDASTARALAERFTALAGAAAQEVDR
ncbi:condensation domain-containing protein [Streptomyces sp. NPDC127049]|uniref:condensation domain-containing protein n=1 Tax=Streptomyces sp. NPDC127049 TaxID=3347118 RepID=UPI00365343E2